MSNKAEKGDEPDCFKAIDLQKIKSVNDLIHPGYRLTDIVGGLKCCKIGMLQLKIESTKRYCNDTINDNLVNGYATSLLKQAARAVLYKVNMYENNLNSFAFKLVVVLDACKTKY